MEVKQKILIDELISIVNKAIKTLEDFKQQEIGNLHLKKNNNEWSVLECLEHLNMYGNFYLPAIENALLKAKDTNENAIFKGGIIGNYFANLMKPKNGIITKMKTPKDKNPEHLKLNHTTIDMQLKQLQNLSTLLHQSKAINLTTSKTAISLTKIIKLRLGDTLKFVVYHIERHIIQAERMLKANL